MKYFFFLLLSFQIIFSFGQSGNWIHYNTSNSGIPSNYVRAITQENDSVFWIGTDAGAARFDGNSWTVFNTSNSGLPHNNVRAIVMDGKTKWFGTLGGGLAKFNDTTWTIYNSSNSGLPYDVILCVMKDEEGSLWIGNANNVPFNTLGGVSVFDKINSWTNYNIFNSGIADLNVRTIDPSNVGEVWIGTINGLSKKVGSNWTTYDTTNSPLPYNDVRDLKKDANGNLWIGTYSGGGPTGGIAKYDGSNWTIYDTSNSSLLANSVSTILIDPCGIVWCGNYYLNKFDGTNWTLFDTTNSALSDPNVFYITESCQRDIWLGTLFDGIYIFQNDCVVNPDCQLSSLDENTSVKSGIEIKLSYLENSILAILIESLNEIVQDLTLVNSLGQSIYSEKISDHSDKHTTEINLQPLSSGIYFLSVQTNLRTISKKIIR